MLQCTCSHTRTSSQQHDTHSVSNPLRKRTTYKSHTQATRLSSVKAKRQPNNPITLSAHPLPCTADPEADHILHYMPNIPQQHVCRRNSADRTVSDGNPNHGAQHATIWYVLQQANTSNQ
eukprot:GHUV01026554.1.p1 GENE.GHUV01026554.1~~GHUV01026554.1.p1  ORF type:complete len:120 (-),score=12.25 GHUV01026554.1:1131-1490(-)